jgi:two-component system NtrC family sensor kinase
LSYFRSISFRVTFWVSLVVVLLVSVHIYQIRPKKRFLEQKMGESERIARIIEHHLLAEMSAGEPDNIQEHLQLLPEQEGIQRVEIFDPGMVVRFSSDLSRVGQTIDRENEAPCLHCHQQENVPERIVYEQEDFGKIFAVDHVLYNGSRCRNCHEDDDEILGNILVEISLTGTDVAALQVRRRLMMFGGLLLVVMLIGVGLIIHFMVGRPTASLKEKMTRLESGDFEIGTPRPSGDEFGALDRGFHNMVTRLHELYTGMEAQIQERTHSLYETQAQLVHQEKLAGIGQLAAGVAHEIGNPLTAIDSLVQLLTIEAGTPETRERVHTIQRQVDRISEIVHAMSDLSRPLSLDVRSVNINGVLQAVLGLVKYDARFRSIKIVMALNDELPPVQTVEDRMFGVFLNLVLNSADAMPDGGTLNISSELSGDHIVVLVRDSGHGIAEENIKKIFDAYFTTKKSGQGTGLGLSVCKSFLRHLGGDIEVESVSGQGTIFRVNIPAVSPTINQGA